MELLIRLILLLLYLMGVLFLGIEQGTEEATNANPTPSGFETPGVQGNVMQVPVPVDTVEVITQGEQVSLRVVGTLPDACDYPIEYEQVRDGSTVSVRLYRLRPADFQGNACPRMPFPYERTIPLEGPFEAGTYTFDVNGQSVTAEF